MSFHVDLQYLINEDQQKLILRVDEWIPLILLNLYVDDRNKLFHYVLEYNSKDKIFIFRSFKWALVLLHFIIDMRWLDNRNSDKRSFREWNVDLFIQVFQLLSSVQFYVIWYHKFPICTHSELLGLVRFFV